MCSAPVPPREVEAPVLAPCPAVRTYIPRGAAPPRLRAPASSHPLQGKSPAPSSLWPAGSRSPIGAHLSPWALPRCARRARRSATAPWRRDVPAETRAPPLPLPPTQPCEQAQPLVPPQQPARRFVSSLAHFPGRCRDHSFHSRWSLDTLPTAVAQNCRKGAFAEVQKQTGKRASLPGGLHSCCPCPEISPARPQFRAFYLA